MIKSTVGQLEVYGWRRGEAIKGKLETKGRSSWTGRKELESGRRTVASEFIAGQLEGDEWRPSGNNM